MASEDVPVVTLEQAVAQAAFVEWQGRCPFCKLFCVIRADRGSLSVGHARPSCTTFQANDAAQFFELCKQKVGLGN